MKIIRYIKKNKKELLLGFFFALFLLLLLKNFFIIGTIPSESMDPILKKQDKVYLKTNYEGIERGKIYAFTKDKSYYIKRCIGIGGDHITIKNDDVYLNGEKLDEVYVSSKIKIGQVIDLDVTVPEDKVFFLGDNREVSYDARFWDEKFVDEKDILGEAIKIVYPFDRIKYL